MSPFVAELAISTAASLVGAFVVLVLGGYCLKVLMSPPGEETRHTHSSFHPISRLYPNCSSTTNPPLILHQSSTKLLLTILPLALPPADPPVEDEPCDPNKPLDLLELATPVPVDAVLDTLFTHKLTTTCINLSLWHNQNTSYNTPNNTPSNTPIHTPTHTL